MRDVKEKLREGVQLTPTTVCYSAEAIVMSTEKKEDVERNKPSLDEICNGEMGAAQACIGRNEKTTVSRIGDECKTGVERGEVEHVEMLKE